MGNNRRDRGDVMMSTHFLKMIRRKISPSRLESREVSQSRVVRMCVRTTDNIRTMHIHSQSYWPKRNGSGLGSYESPIGCFVGTWLTT